MHQYIDASSKLTTVIVGFKTLSIIYVVRENTWVDQAIKTQTETEK